MLLVFAILQSMSVQRDKAQIYQGKMPTEKITFVKLPSNNTFSRVIVWLALEVLAKREHISQPRSESLPPSQLPPNHSSV